MNSVRYLVSRAVFEALRDAPELAGARVLDNPSEPQALAAGERIVFVEDQSDGFIDQSGQAGTRRFVFAIGVINRTSAARAGADADYVAAEAAVRERHTALIRELGCGPLREREVSFRVEAIDVGGALVLGTFEVEYRRPRRA